MDADFFFDDRAIFGMACPRTSTCPPSWFETFENFDSGGFAGPVWAEKAKYLPCLYGEGDVSDSVHTRRAGGLSPHLMAGMKDLTDDSIQSHGNEQKGKIAIRVPEQLIGDMSGSRRRGSVSPEPGSQAEKRNTESQRGARYSQPAV